MGNCTSANVMNHGGLESVEEGRVEDDFLTKAALEDCPVCLVPLPLDGYDTVYWPCCGKRLCCACVNETRRATRVTNRKRVNNLLPPFTIDTCAFCRTVSYKDNAELIQRFETRIEKGDGRAAYNLAGRYRHGDNNFPRDEKKALQLYHRAADLGCISASGHLGFLYAFGEEGVERDTFTGRKFLETAVKEGSVDALYYLGCLEQGEGKMELALKCWRLAASAGDEGSMKNLQKAFSMKLLSKDVVEEALRMYQVACGEMISDERERYTKMKKAEAQNVGSLRLYRSYYNGELSAKELEEALMRNEDY